MSLLDSLCGVTCFHDTTLSEFRHECGATTEPGLHHLPVLHSSVTEMISPESQHIVFFDPPCGGTAYDQEKGMDLYLSGKHIYDVCKELRTRARYCVLKVSAAQCMKIHTNPLSK